MGLDTTHDCWHGAYSAFMRWRTAVAQAAGIPLLLMEGYHRCPEKSFMEECLATGYRAPGFIAKWAQEVDALLPLSWDLFAGDAITVLLNHSDCDGFIAAADCTHLADRLEELIPALDAMQQDEAGHVARAGGFGGAARKFVAGLRRAAEAGEDVGFH